MGNDAFALKKESGFLNLLKQIHIFDAPIYDPVSGFCNLPDERNGQCFRTNRNPVYAQ